MKKKMIILENINPKEVSPVLPKKIQKDFVVTKWGVGGELGFDLARGILQKATFKKLD